MKRGKGVKSENILSTKHPLICYCGLKENNYAFSRPSVVNLSYWRYKAVGTWFLISFTQSGEQNHDVVSKNWCQFHSEVWKA